MEQALIPAAEVRRIAEELPRRLSAAAVRSRRPPRRSAKTAKQDGKAPSLELARADLKTAGGENVTPFELLGRIGDLTGGVPEDEAAGQGSLEWNLGRWHEYERATRGRRAIEWTRYLRQILGIEGGDSEDDDLDLLLGADAEGGELRAGVAMTEEGWSAVARRALDLAATEAAEGTDGNTDPAAMGNRVREVLALADVADTVVVLTSAEVSRGVQRDARSPRPTAGGSSCAAPPRE